MILTNHTYFYAASHFIRNWEHLLEYHGYEDTCDYSTKIKIPEVSGEIAFNFSAILAAAITSDKVDVSKKADAMVVLVSNQRLM